MKRTQIKRKKRVNPVNRKRKAERFRKAFLSDERVAWVHEQGCVTVTHGTWVGRLRPLCDGPVVVAHVKSRAAGGGWWDVCHMCYSHHLEQHAFGIKAFEAKYGLDLAAIAAELATRGPQE